MSLYPPESRHVEPLPAVEPPDSDVSVRVKAALKRGSKFAADAERSTRGMFRLSPELMGLVLR